MIFHENVDVEKIKMLINNYKPFLVPKAFYVIKENFINPQKQVSKFFVNRFPLTRQYVLKENDYRLLFYRLTDEALAFITKLENCMDYRLISPDYSDDELKLLYILTKQRTIYWVNNSVLLNNPHINKDYNSYLKTHFASATYASEVMAKYNSFKYGIPYMYNPGQVSVLTTSRCNANCVHCYRKNSIHEKELLTTEKFLKFIDEIHDLQVTSVNLLGGEPLLRDDIKDIIKKCVDCNIRVKITTNAIKLADEDYLKDLVSVFDNSLSFFQISIDGIGEVQDKLRVNAGWDLMTKAFENLGKYNVPWITNTVLTKPLYNNLENFFRVMNSYQIPVMRFSRFKRCGGGSEYKNLALTPYEEEKARCQIEELSVKYNQKIKNSLSTPIFICQDIPSKKLDNAYQSCNAMNYQFCLSYNLQYMSCEFIEPFKEYWGESFDDMSVKDFWNNSALIQKFRKIQLKGKCTRCAYNLYCPKGCPVETLYMTGDISNSTKLCSYNPDKPREPQLELPDNYEFMEEGEIN